MALPDLRLLQLRRRDFGLRRDVAQIEANSLHVAILERVLVDRRPGHAEVAGSIDVGAAVVGHGEKHHAVAVNVSRLDEGLLVGFPDAVDDGRLSRISGGAMIEFAAEVDHSHGAFLPRFAVRPRSIRVVAHYSR
jgi:hypothetical protein